MIVDRLTERVCERLTRGRLSGRTVTVKIRLFDFTTHTRSATVAGPTDDLRTLTRLARRLLTEVDTSAGVRLLGVGVSGLADWVQGDLFASSADVGDGADTGESPVGSSGGDSRPDDGADSAADPDAPIEPPPRSRHWSPGADAMHSTYGPGWVWGAGLRRVTVRFETASGGTGSVRTFAADDPELAPYTPLTWTAAPAD